MGCSRPRNSDTNRSIGFIAWSCLLATAASFPTKAADRAVDASFKAIPLPKLSNFQFPASLSPPIFRGITALELQAFTAVTSLPAITVPTSTNIKRHPIDERDILGADNRVLIHNTTFPYSAIGRVLWSDGSYCTGTLVGDRVVATASHCVPWTQSSISMIFQPDFYDTNVYTSSNVTDVAYVIKQTSSSFDSSPCGLEKDFALLKMGTVLSGVTGGTFGVTTALASGLVHEGYPSDLANGARPYQQTGLTATVSSSLKCDANGPLSTTADAAGGQSGGPLYIPQIKSVVGVLSAGTATSTVFAGGSSFVNLVNWARTNWPA